MTTLDPKLARALKRHTEQIDHHTTERNRLIREAAAAGASTRQIGEACGMSNVGVWRIVQK